MIYTTKDFPIKLDYWYIVSFGDFYNITLYPVYFINRISANRAIAKSFSKIKRGSVKAISSKKLKQYELNYKIKLGRLPHFTKYDFDPNWTDQQKKNGRTIIRRRLRRMGMLIPKKHKIFFKDNIKPRKVLVNKQKVAMSPFTEARAFRLERLSKKNYFIILEKTKGNGNGVAFKVDSIKYNIGTGKFKRKLLNIYTKDVIIPHLISEVFARALNKGNYDEFKKYCRNQGVRIYKERPKEVLSRMVQKMGK